MSARYFPLLAIAFLVPGATALQIFAMFQDDGLSKATLQLWYFTFSYAVACWVHVDRREREIPAPFEYSAFMFFAWPMLAPWYLFKSRGWLGFAMGLGLIALCQLPDLATLAVYYLMVDE